MHVDGGFVIVRVFTEGETSPWGDFPSNDCKSYDEKNYRTQRRTEPRIVRYKFVVENLVGGKSAVAAILVLLSFHHNLHNLVSTSLATELGQTSNRHSEHREQVNS